MDLYEYQAKHLFGKHHVPVVPGAVCETPDAARLAARRIGGMVVVKAQVKVGGRGKAGGVKLADGEDEASDRARDILGMDIKGHTVHKVLVTEAADIAEEYYVSFLLHSSKPCSTKQHRRPSLTQPTTATRLPILPSLVQILVWLCCHIR